MSRRDFRTPSSIPIASTGRCIVVPDDAAWLGLLNAALLMLTEQWRYDQVESTDLTPEEVAAIWYDIYVSTLTSACDDCPDMNCDDVLQCIVDGGFSLSPSDLPVDQRVVGGVPQVSFDGGTTWVDVFGDTDAAPIVKAPSATSGANDDAKICLASSRAALVLAEFYKQTFGAFTADITNALGTFNNFLQELNSALLGLAYGQAAQMLNAEIMRDQDWETNYTAAELSSGALEDLLCLLVSNASIDASGVVTFDYGAIRDNVIADVGINPGTALWFLLGNMQQGGLNAAGSVLITDTGDCSHCEPSVCDDTGTPASLFTIFDAPDVWTPAFAEAYMSCGLVYQGDWGATYGAGYDQVVLSLPSNLCIYRIDLLQVYRPANVANRITSVDTYVGSTLVSSGVNVSTTNCTTYTMFNNPSSPVRGDFVRLTFPAPAAGILRTRGITVYYYEH